MKRIAIFGNGRAPIPSIEYLQKNKFELMIVVDPNDTGEDTWQTSLKLYCIKHAISYLNPLDFNDKAFLKQLTTFSPDIILSMQCRKIIQEEIISIVRGEIFNFHFADLPRNRGCFPGLWHLLNNDLFIGITLHRLTAEIDDGPIIDKIRRKIAITDTGRSVYDWSCEQVLPLLRRNVHDLLDKSYKTTPQKENLATFYSRNSLNFTNLFVDWNKPGAIVARYIQAFIFPPYQFPKTRYKNQSMEIHGVKKVVKKKRRFVPGRILSVNKNNIEVQVADGSVTITVNNKHNSIKKVGFFYL